MGTNCWGDTTNYNFAELVDSLNRYLRLGSIPVGMKRFATEAEMMEIPRIKRPTSVQATDQLVGQARLIGWTLGFTMKDLMGPQCGAVVGLSPRDENFLGGGMMNGVWFSDLESSARHQAEMDCAPHGEYEAMAISPLTAGRLTPPDICLVYATPGQMILLINALQWKDYQKYSFSVVGESACADSWGRALQTGEPSVSIPCYAERKFGGVADDELLIAMPPSFLPKAVEGLAALSKNGLRYPIPNIGIQSSPMASIAASYGNTR